MLEGINGEPKNGQKWIKLKQAFHFLLEAADYAQDVHGSPWDFAIPLQFLCSHGLNENDLRWLVRKNLVEHAFEITILGSNGREFRPTGDLTFGERTCFILTPQGISAARAANTEQAASAEAKPATNLPVQPNGDSANKPHWDPDVRELYLGEIIVKRFKWHAFNQEAILNTFQEEGWPAHIDDPLVPVPDQDSKRRLCDTIKCLNRKQQNQLIHFRGDGTGEGVIWERLPGDGPSGR